MKINSGIKNKVFLSSASTVCRPSLVLSSRLIAFFKENGYVITKSIKEADYIALNTCGATDDFEVASLDFFEKSFKSCKRGARILSIGCLNSINRERLKDKFPYLEIIDDFTQLDAIMHVNIKYSISNDYSYDESLFEYINYGQERSVLMNISMHCAKLIFTAINSRPNLRKKYKYFLRILNEMNPANRVYVQIGSGCVSNCSYCAVKKAKGNPVSRSVKDILTNIKEVYQKGKKIMLVADDCGSYGIDIKEKFVNLIESINKAFPDVPLGISWLNPCWIEKYPNMYLEIFKNTKISSVNLSLQSGSDRIVGLMNRKYKVKNILDFILEIRKVSPDTVIISNFIVGYPQETWEDYWSSLKTSGSYDHYQAFIYSARKGTKSAQMQNTNSHFVCKLRERIFYIKFTGKMFKNLCFKVRNN